MNARNIHMPPSWSAKKKSDFIAWINDELSKDEERELLQLHRPPPTEAQ